MPYIPIPPDGKMKTLRLNAKQLDILERVLEYADNVLCPQYPDWVTAEDDCIVFKWAQSFERIFGDPTCAGDINYIHGRMKEIQRIIEWTLDEVRAKNRALYDEAQNNKGETCDGSK